LRDTGPVHLTWSEFLRGYLALVIAVSGLAVLLERGAGLDPYRTGAVACGLMFCLAALGRPARLYLLVRNTCWFALIRDEQVMRLLLGVLGLALVGAGLLLPPAQLPR
jgi:hypothetical protein